LATLATRAFRPHYAWIIVLVTFALGLVTASVRAAPGILIKPLEAEFGWDRAAISLAVGIGFVLNALGAPLGGSLLDRFGPRRVALAGIGLMILSLAPMPFMTELWHLHFLWGIVNSLGAGIAGGGIGAVVAARWFHGTAGW
jgi:MFS family permease